MARKADHSGLQKISRPFQSRLGTLGRSGRVRAIVMLNAPAASQPSGVKPARGGRQAAVDEVRRSALPGLTEIDGVLSRFEGKRFADQVDALGCVPVETLPDGIRALARLECVKAIMEDQPITLLKTPRREPRVRLS
jgi:hypothetical protein